MKNESILASILGCFRLSSRTNRINHSNNKGTHPENVTKPVEIAVGRDSIHVREGDKRKSTIVEGSVSQIEADEGIKTRHNLVLGNERSDSLGAPPSHKVHKEHIHKEVVVTRIAPMPQRTDKEHHQLALRSRQSTQLLRILSRLGSRLRHSEINIYPNIVSSHPHHMQ